MLGASVLTLRKTILALGEALGGTGAANGTSCGPESDFSRSLIGIHALERLATAGRSVADLEVAAPRLGWV